MNNNVKEYIKKPLMIEAIRFYDDAETTIKIQEFVGNKMLRISYAHPIPFLTIPTAGGEVRAPEGFYIVKNDRDDIYSLSPELFDELYAEPKGPEGVIKGGRR
jgi:hypothetical protein